MAATAAPYGLRPVNLIGGQHFQGGQVRQIPMTVNVANPIGAGDVIIIGAASAGQPTPATATVTTSTGGVLGVCVGVSFIDPTLKQQQFANSLPTGAVTAGYTNIMIHVNDDPNQLYMIQSAGSVARTVQGKFCALDAASFNTLGAYGNSTLRGLAPANTATLALRIVDFASTPGDAFTDLIVKFNSGVLMWNNTTVLAN